MTPSTTINYTLTVNTPSMAANSDYKVTTLPPLSPVPSSTPGPFLIDETGYINVDDLVPCQAHVCCMQSSHVATDAVVPTICVASILSACTKRDPRNPINGVFATGPSALGAHGIVATACAFKWTFRS